MSRNRLGYDRHHTIPLSLWWINQSHNIMNLKRQVHQDLHSVLNIERKLYHRLMRQARKKTNGKLVRWPEDVEIRGKLQYRFFENLHKLPRDVIRKHVKNMRNQCRVNSGIYKERTWVNYWPLSNPTDYDHINFHFQHKQLINIQKDLASSLIWMYGERVA